MIGGSIQLLKRGGLKSQVRRAPRLKHSPARPAQKPDPKQFPALLSRKFSRQKVGFPGAPGI
jgi:hypothetical protein